MFFISDCSEATKTLARTWIINNLGAVHDGGHVDAVCRRLQHNSPLVSAALLLNTLAYSPQSWRDYQNASAPSVHTYAWTEFVFKI